MHRLLIAIALTGALSAPAIAAVGKAEPASQYHRTQAAVAQPAAPARKHAEAVRAPYVDPYWTPCDYMDTGSCG